MENPKLDPGDLTNDELLDIVVDIRNILWPFGRRVSDYTWEPDATVDSIAQVLAAYHLDY